MEKHRTDERGTTIEGCGSFVDGPVYAAETERIGKRRRKAGERPARETDRAALCLSGGGIRSATFNLGLLQALERHGKLKWMDYLSTVSGGGYIGSCLTWFRAMGFGFPFGTSRKDHDKTLGGGVLDWLRAHGNYLTPGDSLNAWALASAVLTGSVVSLLIVMPLLLALVYLLGHTEVSLTAADALITKKLGVNDGFRALFAAGVLLAGAFFVSIVVFALLTGIRSLRSSLWNNRFRATGGVLLSLSILFLVVGSLPICYEFLAGPRFQGWLKTAMSSITVTGIIGIAGSLFGKKPGDESKGARSIILPLASTVAAYGVFLWAYHLIGAAPSFPRWLMFGLAVSTLLALVSNINHVSMHRFYRNRLMDAYMPDELLSRDEVTREKLRNAAETKRKKGADPSADQFSLADIEPTTDAPYHIINANLQVVSSKRARLKERGGECFIMSPEYCGSEHTEWVKTSEYLGGTLNLATAMAISGAAVDPNTYVTRSRSLSFLMTLFNLRLGYWTLNPSKKGLTVQPYIRRVLMNLSWYSSLFADLVGLGLTEKRRLIHLSDGGHFENLGLYEMVRRECSQIVVSDAGADPSRTVEDLARALAMIRIDFGAKAVGFKTEKLAAGGEDGLCEEAFTSCTIHYRSGKRGTLYYIKPTLVGDLPPDIYSYHADHKTFPHESTVDQFFDERQFEAYRELGYRIGERFAREFEMETVPTQQEAP